ncbi:MAG TPA: tetratricopeptide repeat protein, partial [Vicinamibacterales bacterium]
DIESLYVEALRRASADGAPVRAELVRFWSARLSKTGVNDAARAEILHALIDLQEFGTVLPSLVVLARQDDAWLFAYVDGSIRTGRKPELVKFLQSELDRLDLTWPKRTARLHLLREHGGDAAALPYLRQFAEVLGGDWLPTFEDALEKLNRDDELIAFWKSRVRGRDVEADVKRGIAARSLAKGEKALAESILLALAANAPSDSPDVMQLLYVWGPGLTDRQLDWLEGRARASSGADRTQWMQHLMNAGAPQRAVDVAQGAYSEVYLHALVAAGRGEALSRAITERVADVSNPGELRFLARTALEGSQPAAMRAAYEKLLGADPDDAEALRYVGALDHVESRFSQARARLGRYIANGGSDYVSHFSFAEILARDGERARARAHFERSLVEIARFEQPTAHMRTIQALGLHRVGRTADAFAAFGALLVEFPENEHLRADYVAALLQSSRYAEAARVLSQVAAAPPPTAPEQRDGRLRLQVLSAQLLQAEARSGPAAAKLRLLLAEHPTYVPALIGLAQVERERGRWRIADALLQRALDVDPVNEDARRTRADLRGTHGGHLQLQTESLQIAGGQRERRSRVSADDLVAGGVRLGTIVEQNQVALAGRRYTRARGEVFLQSELESGLELRTSGFATGGALGGGLRIGHADGPRRTFVQADIRKPYWEAVEAVVGNDTRDRVEVHHDDQLGRRVSLGMTGALNRYGGGEAADEAHSAALDGNVGFSLRLGNPTLVARYGVDLESVDVRPPDALPAVSREVHAGSASLQQRLGRTLAAEATAGYAWDRRGGAGPFGSGHLTYDGPGRLGLQLWFERRLHTLSTDQRVTRAGANIVVKLD